MVPWLDVVSQANDYGTWESALEVKMPSESVAVGRIVLGSDILHCWNPDDIFSAFEQLEAKH